MTRLLKNWVGNEANKTRLRGINRRVSVCRRDCYLSTPPGSSSMIDDKGRPLVRVQLTRGEGIPPVTRHCSRTLPPAITVCVASGYTSTAGGSRPAQSSQCKISGSYNTNYEDDSLTWYCAVKSHRSWPTLQRHLLQYPHDGRSQVPLKYQPTSKRLHDTTFLYETHHII